jgi:hypothetical protein
MREERTQSPAAAALLAKGRLPLQLFVLVLAAAPRG